MLEAAGRGGFDPPDAHLESLALTLDSEGFEAAARELEEMAGKLRAIAADNAERLAAGESGDGEVPALAVTMLLETAGSPLEGA